MVVTLFKDKIIVLFLSFLTLNLAFCTGEKANWDDLFQHAGNNQIEVQKLIEFYKNLETENQKAFVETLNKLRYGYRINYVLKDSFRQKEIYRDTIWDLATLKAEFIIQDFELAYSSWKKNKWGKNVSFEDFSNLILPYRLHNENIENWRGFFFDRYSNYSDDIPSDAGEVYESLADYVNCEIAGWKNGYKPQFLDISNTASVTEYIKNSESSNEYEDIAAVNVFALRSLGIPCTYEIIPKHAKRNGGEAYTVIRTNERFQIVSNLQSIITFKKRTGQLVYNNQEAKIFRREYVGKNPFNTIKSHRVPETDIPIDLNLGNVIDVTAERTNAKDLIIKNPGAASPVLYIGIYNFGHWQVCHWGLNKQDQVTFDQMGTNVVYHLLTFTNGKSQLIDRPFTYDTSGVVKFISSDQSHTQKMTMSHEGSNIPVINNELYTVSYWDDASKNWKIITKVPASNNEIRDIPGPANGLFRIHRDGHEHTQRPFTYVDNVQIWW